MKALSVLSKFIGCYDMWKEIKERYQLKWSNGNNSLQVFQTIVNNETNYDSMLKWVKDTCLQIPKSYANILIYCTLTGLRADEACQSISIIKNNLENYLNKDKNILEHFKFQNVFLRKTKQSYISIVNDSILELANNASNFSYNALRCHLRRKNIQMNMNYCRKIFATFMRSNGIEQEIIDLLQGRIPKAVFVRHYYRPDLERFEKIRGLLDNLYKQIIL
ncbi:MAG TPA: integrase [Nitrososphaeraceae archaeon]|nr:integrase [Nitrososphaeraceae archaeon]